MQQCYRFHIQGRVQGVFFRASTRKRANALGLHGWVRNRADGSVETLACGDEHALAQFLDWLWQGPDAARVTHVQREQADPAEADSDGFTIR